MSQTIPAQEQRIYTPDEYLDLEEVAEFRSNYDNGKITPMTGGTSNHNRISRNLCLALTLGLEGQNYEAFMVDLKVWIPKSRKFRYPDVMVVAGEPQYYNNRETAVTNPQIIFEVLSDSTEDFDRDEKFTIYQAIPTFQEYVLVDQKEVSIHQFYKTGSKRWSITQYDAQDSGLSFKSVDLEIPIADIYKKVKFQAE
jgi:Uma2 family endonuclease